MLNKFANEDYNYINRLRVRSFRAHNDISFEPGNASVLILGSNGVVKTSILEAISIFSYGKGIRNAKFYDMINKDKKGFVKSTTCLIIDVSWLYSSRYFFNFV